MLLTVQNMNFHQHCSEVAFDAVKTLNWKVAGISCSHALSCRVESRLSESMCTDHVLSEQLIIKYSWTVSEVIVIPEMKNVFSFQWSIQFTFNFHM